MNALILIDIQKDFLAGGVLPVPEGERILPLVNELVHYPFDLVVATKDWHPLEHGSFAANHLGAKPGDRLLLGGLEQVLWPTHCVQGTSGSEFASGWDLTEVDKIIYKGMDPSVDSYSAFFDNGHYHATGLETYLREHGARNLFFAGLAIDYCVKHSVLDALGLGFHAYAIIDACKGVNLTPQDVEQAISAMQRGGARLLSIEEVKGLLEKKIEVI